MQQVSTRKKYTRASKANRKPKQAKPGAVLMSLVTEEDHAIWNWMNEFVLAHNKRIKSKQRKERRANAPGFPEDN